MGRRTPLAAATAALSLALPVAAHAVALGDAGESSVLSGGSLRVNETFYYKYNAFLDEDPDDDVAAPFPFSEFVNRATMDLTLGRFTLGAQLDFAAVAPGCDQADYANRFTERFGADAPCLPPNELRGTGWSERAPHSALLKLEKIYARFDSRHLNVQLGDFYASLGRGIVLSMIKKPEIDVDNSLLGARADLRTKPLDLTLLAGFTNPQEISMELRNQRISNEPWALIAGGALTTRPTHGLSLSAHGVGYELTEVPSGAVGGTVTGSGIGGALDLFFEGDAFFYGQDEDSALQRPPRGYALYGTATAYAGPFTFLLEGKRYKDAQLLRRPGPIVPVIYTEPPSLELDIAVTEDGNGTIQSNDITGWRLQSQLYLPDSSTEVTFSLLNSFDNEAHPPFSRQREVTVHPWLGLDQPITLPKAELHLAGRVGYRHDFPLRSATDSLPADEVARIEGEYLRNSGLLHFNVDIGANFGPVAVEWVTYYRRWAHTIEHEECWQQDGQEVCSGDDGWLAIENALSATLFGKYTAALHLDFTDDPIVQSLANNGAVGNLTYDADFKASAYVGGEFIARPAENLEIYAFVGSQKAGVVCTGGSCRTVPAFTGFKTRVSVNF